MNSKLKMDNGVNAILSILMIGVGFVNGIGWGNILRLQQISDLQQQVCTKSSLNDDYLYIIENLEAQNKRLKEIIADNQEKLEAIKVLATIPTCLPPPNSPLIRSEPLLRSSSNTSELTPIVSDNKD